MNMPSEAVWRILFVGDVVGRPGRKILRDLLPVLRREHDPWTVVVNGENSAGGLGNKEKGVQELLDAGADLITTGNHVWDKKKDAIALFEKGTFPIIRPINYPPGAPGSGMGTVRGPGGREGLVVNLMGRVFMEPVVDNPFHAMEQVLIQADMPVLLVDFHGEASAEKMAMGFFLDGRVGAVLGTHTHVPTLDTRILPKGTAYQTDVGMTGPLDSIIGMETGPIIQKFLTGMHHRFQVAKGPLTLDYTVVDLDLDTMKAVRVESFRRLGDTALSEPGSL